MRIDKDKPLVEMTPQEFEAAMDQVGLDLVIKILEAARNEPMPMALAVAFLKPAGSTEERVASFAPEFGDGDGIREQSDFVDQANRVGALLPGETLTLRVVKVTYWEEVLS